MDAKSGTGLTENALSAQHDGFFQMEYVFQLITCAQLGMPKEHALPVTKDITLKMENVFTVTAQTDLKIWDAKHGIGKSKFVTNAQKNGIIRKEQDVFKETHSVNLQMIMEPAQPATKDTI